MKFCGNCGHQLNDNDVFCPNCGYKVKGQTIDAEVKEEKTVNTEKPVEPTPVIPEVINKEPEKVSYPFALQLTFLILDFVLFMLPCLAILILYIYLLSEGSNVAIVGVIGGALGMIVYMITFICPLMVMNNAKKSSAAFMVFGIIKILTSQLISGIMLMCISQKQIDQNKKRLEYNEYKKEHI